MGCDIHGYVEIRRRDHWEKVGAVLPNPYYDREMPADDWPQPFTEHLTLYRDYNVFAILADVRNERNYLDLPSKLSEDSSLGDGFEPISEPRGLPEDVSPEVRAAWNGGGDDHSHSWLSLYDLLACDWSQSTRFTWWTDAEGYQACKETGRPSSGYRVPYGPKLSNAEMDKVIAARQPRTGCTRVEWWETYAEAARQLWTHTIPGLVAVIVPVERLPEVRPFLDASQAGDTAAAGVLNDWLEENGLPKLDDIRMVFWFDN